jgi:branched-chain amino acid transport system substrate-binding protein
VDYEATRNLRKKLKEKKKGGETLKIRRSNYELGIRALRFKTKTIIKEVLVMEKKKVLALLASLVAVFILTGLPVATCQAKSPTDKPIKIGALTSVTGVNAHPTCAEGAALASEHFPEVAGRPIKVMHVDDGSNPKIGLERAKKLVEVDKVDFLLGPRFGPVKDPVLMYTKGRPVIHMTVALDHSYGQAKSQGSDHCYRAVASAVNNNYMLYKWLSEKWGARTFNSVITDLAGIRVAVDAAKRVLKDVPGGKMLKELYVPLGEMDMASYVTALDKSADVTVKWIAGPPGTIFAKTYSDFGLKMPLVRFDGGEFVWDQQLKKIPVVEGMTVITPYAWTIDNPTNKRFVEAYKKRFGHFPDSHATTMYMDIKIIHDVLQETGGDTSPDKFHRTISKLTFDLPRGPVSFDERTRFVIGDLYICKIQKVNGVLTPVVIDVIKQVKTWEPEDL